MSRSIEACGHEVIVANARRVRLVYAGMRKNDRLDAERLARLARFDQGLLAPVRHRGRVAQADLAVLQARDCLVKFRTALINHVRGCMKSFGLRVPSCASSVFHVSASEVYRMIWGCQGPPTFPQLGDSLLPAREGCHRLLTWASMLLRRKLRPSMLTTWQWCSSRSRMTVASTSSPASISGH